MWSHAGKPLVMLASCLIKLTHFKHHFRASGLKLPSKQTSEVKLALLKITLTFRNYTIFEAVLDILLHNTLLGRCIFFNARFKLQLTKNALPVRRCHLRNSASGSVLVTQRTTQSQFSQQSLLHVHICNVNRYSRR